jgi:hypothetical protein
MADESNTTGAAPPAPIARTTRPLSEALLNDKVCFYSGSLLMASMTASLGCGKEMKILTSYEQTAPSPAQAVPLEVPWLIGFYTVGPLPLLSPH